MTRVNSTRTVQASANQTSAWLDLLEALEYQDEEQLMALQPDLKGQHGFIAGRLLEVAEQLNVEKFSAADLEQFFDVPELGVDYDFASTRAWIYRWLLATSSTFEFVTDNRSKFLKWGELSDGQLKGVANCALADARRSRRDMQTGGTVVAPKAATAEALEAGIYRDPSDQAIYKVQKAVHGSGNMYAKKLTVVERTHWSFNGTQSQVFEAVFEFAPGAIRKIQPSWRLSLEEAKAFGALYGICVQCGRTLTDEKSIEAGIGPICAGRI